MRTFQKQLPCKAGWIWVESKGGSADAKNNKLSLFQKSFLQSTKCDNNVLYST